MTFSNGFGSWLRGRRRTGGLLRTAGALAILAAGAAPLQGQTIDDGVMLAKRELFVGGFYSHDSWDEYWEGALKRNNGNIGTLTTETQTWFANYGLTDRLNVIVMVP
jgi:hypothetical protein